MSDKKDLINLLEKIADILDFNGENPFKVNAYRNAANTIRRTAGIEQKISSQTLDSVKGIGKGLQSVIYEFNEKGSSELYSSLKKEMPAGIEQLFKIRGLGPKKIRTLHSELGISNLGELEYACKENRLALLKGFGATTQERIIHEIEMMKTYNKFVLQNTAEKYSDEILERISILKSVSEVAVSGELRRGMEVISSIEIILLISDEKNFQIEFDKLFVSEKHGNEILIKNSYMVPIKVILTSTEKEFNNKLFVTTGSPEFLSHLGVDELKSESTEEKEIFDQLRAPFVIPEMREKEYFKITKDELKKNSDLSFDHFRGLLHFHTTYSDGRDSLSDMISAASKMGFEYAAVCDHSKSAFYANGLSEERIMLQKQEIKDISSKDSLAIFQGIESDILPNGGLDYSEDFLSNFDFVVASIHSVLNMEHDEMTIRIIKAVENPYTDLLGHPSGRLLLSRDPFKFDQKKVIDACAANNVAIEINANPHRLDLDWRWIYYAREKGCLFAVNPDAHSTEEISYIKYGILTGRKGGLQSAEVINCFDLNEFKKYLNRKTNRNF